MRPQDDRPLSGIRILDFSRQFAGALGTRFLAGFGAEVLRAEWPEPPGFDFVRTLIPAENLPGFNRGGMFNGANVDKRSFTLNMGTQEGRELAKELVKISDVVYENMTPRVMDNWGMGYEALTAIKPDIIYVSCSGFGRTGPTAHYRSYGSPSQAHTGIVHLAGIPGRPPAGWGFQIGDTHAGTNNALTVLMALHQRRRTGKGLFVDSAQTQGNITLSGVDILEHSANGTLKQRPDFPPANKRLHPRVAPHNVYPCLGNDRWCAIAVLDDAEWRSLKDAMGNPAWAERPELDTAEGRCAHEDELDREIADWTMDRDRFAVARKLQGHGVRAGVVQDARDRLNWDRQLAHRGTYAIYDHPEVGPRRHETVAAKLSRDPYAVQNAAPQIGADNDYVFGELLGLSPERMKALEAADAIRTLVGEDE